MNQSPTVFFNYSISFIYYFNFLVRCAIEDNLLSIPAYSRIEDLNQLVNELLIGGLLSYSYISIQYNLQMPN